MIFTYIPAPYGYFGDSEKECSCSSTMVTRYQKRISGPMMDRIDIHVDVPASGLREAQMMTLRVSRVPSLERV